jgi:hypothetical protein
MHSKADLLGMPQARHPIAPAVLPRPAPLRRSPRHGKPFSIGTRSGYKGVILCPNLKINRWKAYIRHHGQYVTIGYFPTKDEAALAYNAEARRLFGPDTYLNQVGALAPQPTRG